MTQHLLYGNLNITGGRLPVINTENTLVDLPNLAGFLNNDGSGNLSWENVGADTADPTAQVGLTAVNGSADTVMRSDAAPALDVSISPTWTGTHTFKDTNVFATADHNANGSFVSIVFDESDVVAPAFAGVRYRGVQSSPSGVLFGDVLGRFSGRGYNGIGIAPQSTGGMDVIANEDWTVGHFGTAIKFFTTVSGTTIKYYICDISDTGNITTSGIINGSTLISRSNSITLNNKILTVSETMTLTALAASQTYTFPATSGTVALLSVANQFSANQTIINTAPELDLVDTTSGRVFHIVSDADTVKMYGAVSGIKLRLDINSTTIGEGTGNSYYQTEQLAVFQAIAETSGDGSMQHVARFISHSTASGAMKSSMGGYISYFVRGYQTSDHPSTVGRDKFTSSGGANPTAQRTFWVSNYYNFANEKEFFRAEQTYTTGYVCKISFFGAAAVAQQAATTDLGTVLSNYGLRVAGTVYPITTSGAVQLTGGVTISTANLTVTDVNIVLSTTTGTKIGTAANQKLAVYNATPIVQGAALTAQLTTITYTAPSTPDYALQDFTQTSPWGFANHDEANSLLAVVANLQTRVAELEARLGSTTGFGIFA